MKKKINKNGIFYVVISFVAILAVASVVAAYSLNTTINVAGDYNVTEAQQDTPSDINLGAVSGPDLYFPYFNVNGVRAWYNDTGLLTGSTTLAAIKSPLATTTLVFSSLKLTTSTTSASQIEIGKSNTVNPTATTTSLGRIANLAANAQVTMIASSSPVGGGDENLIFAPGTWLVANMAAGFTGTNNAPVGNFKAIFIEN